MLITKVLPVFALLGASLAQDKTRHHHPARASACTPVAGGSASIDDVPAITSAIAKCGKGGIIVIPAGKTYNLNSPLDFAGCVGCDFQLEGTLNFSASTEIWKGQTAMINIKNIQGLKIRSLEGQGVIDGNGQASWDLFAKDSSYRRPTLLYITGGSDIEVSNLRQTNSPNVFNSIQGNTKTAIFFNLHIEATSSSDNKPKNTDGFDIGASTDVTISNVSVTNNDDCVAFKPGADGVIVKDLTCIGSHGLSVGSLGKNNKDFVKNVQVSGARMSKSTKAVGIKTYPSGNGHAKSTVSNITFSDIIVDGCDYAIQIQSCYGEDADNCVKNPGDSDLTGIVFRNVSGKTSGKYQAVTGSLLCGSRGVCDIEVDGYTVVAPIGGSEVQCANTPSKLGVMCTSGTSS
ncbi:Polygalacturonase-2 [Penicillium digitatum]|uniref:Polygalacturonase-2 n=3 Tax=Penicillium digitatum TaxID=36651 RepID=K9FUH1_PEND2|nr:Polygalacturonase-2 [Penicillium digitatum Pd1]EKV12182.1 Polygalacturonase-2 [Penicillium digitatum PHI26]EKV20342.1 Polygalacturonase-2 [Penicillium digitatum Pd1]QQK45299.1 Polygalacturonase-2 [Penicillium digitatum]